MLVKDNHQLLASALAHLGEGVMITDSNLDQPGPKILYVNPAMCRMSGYSSDELINRTPRIFQGQETDRSQLQRIKAELRQGNSTTVELINYRKNGERYFVELFLSPMYDAHGVCTNYVSVVRDLTKQKQLAEALRRREQHLHAVLNTAVDAIITIDERGLIVSANRAATTMFGYSMDELLGQNVSILMPQPFRKEHDQYIRNYLETGHAKVIGIGREVTGLRRDGSLFPIDLAVAQVDDSRLFTGIIRDLTARRELQQQVLEVASEQQRRIGHQLQEGIGQDLTAIQLLASTLMTLIDPRFDASPNSSQSIDLTDGQLSRIELVASRLSLSIAEAIDHVGQLSLGVMPVQLDSMGLGVALKQISSEVSKATGLRCTCRCDRDFEVKNNTVAVHIYRIVREAVELAALRPNASLVEISVNSLEAELLVEVKDDATDQPLADCHGARSSLLTDVMTYRAGIIGAHLSAEKLDPRGHRITLRVNAQMLR